MHIFFEKEKRMFASYMTDFFDKYDELNIYYHINGVYEYLYKKLFMLSIRSLIYEMHILKLNNKLSGSSSEERYNCFEKITETSEFKKFFQSKYPVLYKKMLELINNTYYYVREIYENFEKDKDILNEKINSCIEKIEDIFIGEGDTHNRGKSVAIVYTNAGRLVYKPHSMASDYVFHRLLGWLNDNGTKFQLEGVKYVNRDKYGWQEYVNYVGNLNDNGAKEYYYKCGQFLGLFYILGTTDMHFENVIVHDNTPFFIDLETLVSMPKYINYSNILETDFIPGIHNNLVYDFDYSGLCGKGNISSKIKSISIINPKTDEMRIENAESVIRENRNIVWVNEEKAKIENYINDIFSGINDVWEIIFEKKDEFIALLDEVLSDDSLYYRQVLRATQVYSKFLIAATHPDYLREEESQSLLFNRLLMNVSETKMKQRINDEIIQLHRGDVPYYKVKYNSMDLYSDDGVVCKDYFESTVREGIIKRITETLPKNKIVQLDTIAKSLFTAYDKQFINDSNTNEIVPKEYIENTAHEICNKIVDDPTGTIMLINTLVGERFYLTNINLDMYEGGGIIWFLACYGQLKKKPDIYKLALRLFESAEKCFDHKREYEKMRLSAFSGIGSIIYLTYNLFQLTKENIYYDYLKKYCNEVMNIIPKLELNIKDISQYDFMCGVSGMIIVLCRIYQKNSDEKVKHLIDELKQKLLNSLKMNSFTETGIAHGFSGMVYALIVLDKTFSESNYKELSILYLKQELDIYIDKKQYGLEWCCGVSGLIFVRALAYLQWNDAELKEQLSKLFTLADNIDVIKRNNCLCHGIRGIKESLSIVREQFENNFTVNNKIFEVEEYDFFGLNNHKIENFMMGTSGVAYSYLKNEFNMLPSIMALELYGE